MVHIDKHSHDDKGVHPERLFQLSLAEQVDAQQAEQCQQEQPEVGGVRLVCGQEQAVSL